MSGDLSILSDPVALLQAMLAIDTVNPPGNDSQVCDLLEGPLREVGFHVVRSPLADGRDNLIAYPVGANVSADGAGSASRVPLLCFTGHIFSTSHLSNSAGR